MAKWLGLLIGALIGNSMNTAALVLLSLGGYLLGVWLERRSDPILQHRKYLSKDQEAFQHLLHYSTFMMMGYLAKADGRVSEQEIKAAEKIFDSFQLDTNARKDAIRLFNAGKHPQFQIDNILQPLASVSRNHRALMKVFLEVQARMVIADGGMDSIRRRPFMIIARRLGFSDQAAGNILRRVGTRAQSYGSSTNGSSKHGASKRVKNEQMTMPDAYAMLEVSENCSSKEVKQAYRRAMSEHHPDKLMSEGATEHMIQAATEQTQLIQAAYQTIKKNRG